MYRGNKDFLYDILEACKRILEYTKGLKYDDFLNNTEKQDAVVRNIEIIGEAVKKLSDDFKNTHKLIEWQNIARMRDRLIHFYFGVNLEIVWKVVEIEIPKLNDFVQKMLEVVE